MKSRARRKEKTDSTTTALWIGGAALALAGLGGLAWAFSGDEATADTKKDPPAKDDEPQEDQPAKDPDKPAPDQPPADDGENWGVTPPGLCEEFERAEAAAGIPDLGRFLAVWAWGAFRANKPPVTPAEAAQISAQNPTWCSDCRNDDPSEVSKGKKALDRVTLPKAKGGAYDPPWAMPTDYEGWAKAGSIGLFDILFGAHVHDGIHNGKFTPLVKQPATVAYRTDVQLYVAGYMVYRIVYREDLPVITKGNPAETWSNVRACTATPEGFLELRAGKKTALATWAAEAKQNCLIRAAELGIDLGKLKQPMPWTWPGASEYWKRLDVLSDKQQQVQKPDLNGLQTAGAFSYRRIPAQLPGSPIVWMLHGLTGGVDQLASQASAISLLGKPDAEFILLTRGSSWIEHPDGSPDVVALELAQVAQQLLAQRTAINGQALRPWMVVGYSQGGGVAYQLAALNAPATVLVAAARLPKPPAMAANPTTRIVAIQGGADKTVTPAEGETAAEYFSDAGYKVIWDQYADAGHSLATLGEPLGEVLVSEIERFPAAVDVFPKNSTALQLAGGMLGRIVTLGTLPPNAPLVVCLHGESTNEAQLLSLTKADFAETARWAFLRSPRGDARWAPNKADAATFAAALQSAASSIVAATAQLRAQYAAKKVIFVGYSEGAAVALTLAAQGQGDAALAIAAYLPPSLAPAGPVPGWVSIVFGQADPIIKPNLSQQTADLFKNKAQHLTVQGVATGTHELGSLVDPSRTALTELLLEVG